MLMLPCLYQRESILYECSLDYTFDTQSYPFALSRYANESLTILLGRVTLSESIAPRRFWVESLYERVVWVVTPPQWKLRDTPAVEIKGLTPAVEKIILGLDRPAGK